MIIPKLHYISQGNSPKEHLENIQKACTSGAELVLLNLKNVSEKKYLKISLTVIIGIVLINKKDKTCIRS